MKEINSVVLGDCVQFMGTLPDNCIDLVVTSPPYAEQRSATYGGISEDDFPEWITSVAKEIYRILNPSGSFIMNIKENVNSGARSTYVMKSVLALSEVFVWNETYIWHKTNPFPTGSKKRLKDGFEYCYAFSKTTDYKFNPDSVLVKSDSKYLESEKRRKNTGEHNTNNASGMNMSSRPCSDYVRPSNVISFPTDSANHDHPATFPIELPMFFIKLLSDEGDIVYDPFCGSGTTLVAADSLNRKYIGTDIVSEYVDIARNRLLCEKYGIVQRRSSKVDDEQFKLL